MHKTICSEGSRLLTKTRLPSGREFFTLLVNATPIQVWPVAQEQAARAVYSNRPMLEPNSIDKAESIRAQIADALGNKHVPLKRTVIAWIQQRPDEEQLARRIQGHIDYWLSH